MKEGIDLTGQRFGRLTVCFPYSIKKINSGYVYHYWCECDCESSKAIRSDSLTSGGTKSCGCLIRKYKKIISDCRNAPEYKTWIRIKRRCSNPRDIGYPDYGGRGIRVCDLWVNSFENFYADMGDRPSPKHSIERIDVNGDYCPENCGWATQTEQANNRRTSHYITVGGATLTAAEWGRKTGIKPATILGRLKRGWDSANAVDLTADCLVITAGSMTLTIGQWVKKTGINRSTIHNRLKSGWSPADAVYTPAGQKRGDRASSLNCQD